MTVPSGKRCTRLLEAGSRWLLACHAMAYENLTFAVDDRIATITVNRPDKLNALNERTIFELGGAIDEARDRADVGAVLLTGAGRAFVAGADIAELQNLTPETGTALARRGQDV